jgi:hypothetical protein
MATKNGRWFHRRAGPTGVRLRRTGAFTQDRGVALFFCPRVTPLGQVIPLTRTRVFMVRSTHGNGGHPGNPRGACGAEDTRNRRPARTAGETVSRLNRWSPGFVHPSGHPEQRLSYLPRPECPSCGPPGTGRQGRHRCRPRPPGRDTPPRSRGRHQPRPGHLRLFPPLGQGRRGASEASGVMIDRWRSSRRPSCRPRA